MKLWVRIVLTVSDSSRYWFWSTLASGKQSSLLFIDLWMLLSYASMSCVSAQYLLPWGFTKCYMGSNHKPISTTCTSLFIFLLDVLYSLGARIVEANVILAVLVHLLCDEDIIYSKSSSSLLNIIATFHVIIPATLTYCTI